MMRLSWWDGFLFSSPRLETQRGRGGLVIRRRRPYIVDVTCRAVALRQQHTGRKALGASIRHPFLFSFALVHQVDFVAPLPAAFFSPPS